MNKYIIAGILVILLASILSCRKYLNTSPNSSLAVITTVQDVQALLDGNDQMNKSGSLIGECSTDNYYFTNAQFASRPSAADKPTYLWQKEGPQAGEWQNLYNAVYYANVCLENLDKIGFNLTNQAAWNNCEGSALFSRGFTFFEIAEIWSKVYDSTTADKDLGIPLKLSSDFNIKTERPSVAQTYNQIIHDISAAIPFLPRQPLNNFRPSKPAAYSALARVFLIMGNYQRSKLYADSALLIANTLLDYNKVDTMLSAPFASSILYKNPEIIFYKSDYNSGHYGYYPFGYSSADTTLYSMYSSNDLRKSLFFSPNGDGTVGMDGFYDYGYLGLTVDEMYLTRAECYARLGDANSALADLNTLLQKRYLAGTFSNVTTPSANAALQIILTERRKELISRGLRWSDIKRFNRDGANITLNRIVNGQAYTLPPNDPRYALAIPTYVISQSGIQQNMGW